jgi:hypothetical protein
MSNSSAEQPVTEAHSSCCLDGLTRANWPDPWPSTDEEVRRWRITAPYDFFETRAAVVEALFVHNPESIDGIVLAGVALGTLSEFRFRDSSDRRPDPKQRRFRMLLEQHCPSFVNRISIPEVLRLTRRDAQYRAFEAPISCRYPIARIFQMRRAEEDPLVSDFAMWRRSQSPPVPDALLAWDYAGCIFRLYRNAVVHELRIANGREAHYVGIERPDERPIFYSNHSSAESSIEAVRDADPVDYMRFGIQPTYLLRLLREAIASMREWALANDTDLFQ